MKIDSNIGIWIGAMAAVALLILYMMQSEQSGGTRIEPVFQVSGVSPEVVAIRTQERIARIGANKDTVLGWFAYQLGLEQTASATKLGILQSNNEVRMTEITGETQVKIAQETGLTARQIAQMDADARKYIAAQQAAVAKKGKNINAITGLVSAAGNILTDMFKIFKF